MNGGRIVPVVRFYSTSPGVWFCGPPDAPPLPVDPDEFSLSAMHVVLQHPNEGVSEADLRALLAARPGSKVPGPRSPESWKNGAIRIVETVRLPVGVTENPLVQELRHVQRRGGFFLYLPAIAHARILFDDEAI